MCTIMSRYQLDVALRIYISVHMLWLTLKIFYRISFHFLFFQIFFIFISFLYFSIFQNYNVHDFDPPPPPHPQRDNERYPYWCSKI